MADQAFGLVATIKNFETKIEESFVGIADWLASPCVNANEGNVNWNLFIVTPPGMVNNNNLWNSNNGSNSNTYGVRPADSKRTVVVISFRYCKRRFRIRNKLCPLVMEKKMFMIK